MTIRLLFFPWSAGGGSGYTGRALAAAERLDASFTCAFGPSAVSRMVAEAEFPIIGAEQPTPAPATIPPYLPFANVERVYAVAARYYRPRALAEHLRRDLAAIDEFGPDAVVTDMQPTAVLAARIRGLPVVSFADTDFLDPAPNAWMPWSAVEPNSLLGHPDALEPLNNLAVAHGLPPVGSVTELLWGELTIVPSSPSLEPPPQPPPGRRAPVYIGPLYWDPPGPPYQPRVIPGTHRVYVSIGSGGMVTETAMRQLFAALDRPDVSVFVSAGFRPPDWLHGLDRVEVGGFTGITGPIQWADLVINHGGYSTVLASLLHGRPQLVLPFMSEQEANGRAFVVAQGAGQVVRTTEVTPPNVVRYLNRHGDATDDPVVPAATLAACLNEVLADGGGARAAAERVGTKLARQRETADLSTLLRSVLG